MLATAPHQLFDLQENSALHALDSDCQAGGLFVICVNATRCMILTIQIQLVTESDVRGNYMVACSVDPPMVFHP